MSAPMPAIVTDPGPCPVLRRFQEEMTLLEARKPTLGEMIETLDRVETGMASRQRVLVIAGLRADFYGPDMRDIATLRGLMRLLELIGANEKAVGDVLRRAKSRATGR